MSARTKTACGLWMAIPGSKWSNDTCSQCGEPEKAHPESVPMPHHRFDLRIHVGANDWKDAMRELIAVARHIEDHGPECSSVSGGASGVHSVTIVEDPEITPERYEADLLKWTEARR